MILLVVIIEVLAEAVASVMVEGLWGGRQWVAQVRATAYLMCERG